MKLASISLIVVVQFLLLMMANPQVRASTLFTFTKIADTSGPFTSFGSNPYSINIHGEVAFVGVTAGGIEEVHVGNGGPTRLVADTSGAFDFFTFPPALNDAGTVVYTARLDAGGDVIHSVTVEGSTTTIVDTTGPFESVVNGRVNNSGTVAYLGILDTFGTDPGGDPTAHMEIRKGDGTSSTLIADTQGSFNRFQSGSAINEAGVVSFWTELDVGGTLVGAGDGTTTTTIFSSETPESVFLSPSAHSINATNTVPVVVHIVGGSDELRIGNGGPTTLIKIGSGFSSGAPAINDNGIVVFKNGGLFTSLDVDQPVLSGGDMLDGKTIGNLDYAAALNNQNQFAFRAFFGDNSQAIYRVTIVPEPTALTALSLLGIGLMFRRRRLTR
ncbi:MAG: PEP-CTERM sorting domain-containing protein [Planctomycetes bacterium]|nr:PEP-CTERM sorting domain-containing protein [Planctomycetota bacterium]